MGRRFCYTVGMSWAARRRLIILLIIGAVGVAFFTVLSVTTFYRAPSCSDGTQNQDEAGIDCGGFCAYLCIADQQPPTVLFTKALSNSEGRTDIIASIENKNATAGAKDVPYRIALYDGNQTLIQEVTGTLDLPPGSSVPVFVPNITSGKQKVVGAFLTIEASALRWFALARDPRIVPLVSNTKQGGTLDAPRVEATLSNSSVSPLRNVRVVIFIRDEQRDIIAASQTVVPSILGQGQATATFTWNSGFSSTPASLEVVPIISLPDR